MYQQLFHVAQDKLYNALQSSTQNRQLNYLDPLFWLSVIAVITGIGGMIYASYKLTRDKKTNYST